MSENKFKNLLKDRKKLTYIGIAVTVVIVLVLAIFTITSQSQLSEREQQIEELKLANEQLALAGEYEQLNTAFINYETQTKFLANDSLIVKYGEAKDKVEKLLTELKTQKITSEKRIRQLKDEISSLKNIMRHYIEQIDSLKKENAGLKAENKEIKNENRKLTSHVDEIQKKNEVLNERMTLAEKLNVTGLTLIPIKGNGKLEKKIKKARQLKVTFTIPQNNSTPVGEKTIFLRITNPEGSLLGGNGTFEFEGGNVEYTERKTIEYTGEEIPDIAIFWNVNATLTPGEYRVELFADNYRIASKSVLIKK